MKVLPRFQALAVVALGVLVFSSRSSAQSIGLGVVDSPDPVATNSLLTYTISLTNQANAPLQTVSVTNELPSSVQVVNTGTSQGVVDTSTPSIVIFNLGQVSFPGIVQMTLTTRPTAAGSITNIVTVFTPSLTTLTRVVVPTVVSNIAPATADLAVSMSNPSSPVLTNDWVTYNVAVTNLGPSTASGVVLSNLLPSGVGFIVASPTNQPSTNGTVFFNLGALPSLAVRNFTVTVQPTNTGAVTLTATVNGVNITDPNPANNTAVTSFTVTNALAGQLVTSLVSTQKLNRQVGLLEQTILLSNAGPTAVQSARVLVTGLTNQLFNAVGTNNHNPFVVHGAALGAGQAVNLLLQFFPNRSSFPFNPTNQLHAMETPSVSLSAPASPGTLVTNVTIFKLSTGGMLLEFPAQTGRLYSVVYSDTLSFSNSLLARPSLIAPANFSEWVDYGPPATVSHPTNSNSRFYRVFLSP